MNIKKIKAIIFNILFFLIFSVFLFSSDPLSQIKKLYDLKKYDEALRICNVVLTKYPESDWEPKVFLWKAKIYEKQNRYDKAIKEYKKIILKYKKTSWAEESFFSIARLREEQGKINNAIKAYKSYLSQYPYGEYRVIALFNLANIFKNSKKYNTALKYYNKILLNYPDKIWFYSLSAIYSGHIYMHKNQYKKAIQSYNRVINKKNNESLYILSKLYSGLAYLKIKDYKSSKEIFQNILRNSRYFSEEALIGLGLVHYKSKEYELAKEVFTSILDIFPNTIWKDYIEKKLKKIDKKLHSYKKSKKKI